MGNFSKYRDLAALVRAYEGPQVCDKYRQATQEELDHLFGRKRKLDSQMSHYANNEDFGQF